MKSMKCLIVLAASVALGTLAPCLVEARGPVGQTGMNALSTTPYGTQFVPNATNARLNALSTTPYGTQITPTNSGPVGRSPMGGIGPVYPGAVGTNSISGTKMLFGNVPYGGMPTAATTAPGFMAPQFNGSGSAAGLRPTSFTSGFYGPLLIPESLGNPEQNGMNPATRGKSSKNPALIDYRSLSAYGDIDRGQKSSPPVNSRSSYEPDASKQIGPNPAVYDYHSLSAYGDLERGQDSAPSGTSNRANAPNNASQPASNTNGRQAPAKPLQYGWW